MKDSMNRPLRRVPIGEKAPIGFTCGVGVAPLRFLEKIASGMDIPGGLHILLSDEVAGGIGSLPIGKVPGTGQRTAERKSISVASTMIPRSLEKASPLSAFGMRRKKPLYSIPAMGYADCRHAELIMFINPSLFRTSSTFKKAIP